MFAKKGLSDIVTNVLIILLVLVAVGIIWAFVSPLINKGGEATEGYKDCLTVQLEPVSCPSAGNVIVKRNAGEGTVVAVGAQFTGANGLSSAGYGPATNIFASNQVTVVTTGLTTPYKVKAFAVVKTSSGNRTCDPSPVEISC